MNFLRKIFSPGCLVISFLLLFYLLYRYEIVFPEKNLLYIKLYKFCGILIVLSIVTFFLKENIKDYLIISLISIAISLYIFEGYLTLKHDKLKISNTSLYKSQTLKAQLYKKKTGKIYDTRSLFKIYDDLKKIDRNITTVVPINYYFGQEKNFLLPLSGVSNSKTIHCNENGYYTIYKSDRYGFNNPDEEWDKKEIEYLLVGDSYTHGECVNRPNDIASVLRTLSKKSALNLGFDGNGPLLEYATLREYLNPNVKNVLWIYFEGNDLDELNVELNEIRLQNYLNDLTFTQNLRVKQNKIDQFANAMILDELPVNEYKEVTEKGKKKKEKKEEKKNNSLLNLKNFITISKVRYLLLKPRPKRPQLTKFKETLKLTKNLVNENNSKLYFIYLPEYFRYKIKYNNSNYLLVKKIVNKLGITFIDINEEVFKKELAPLKLFPYETFGHYNVMGYKKVAETIYKLTIN